MSWIRSSSKALLLFSVSSDVLSFRSTATIGLFLLLFQIETLQKQVLCARPVCEKHNWSWSEWWGVRTAAAALPKAGRNMTGNTTSPQTASRKEDRAEFNRSRLPESSQWNQWGSLVACWRMVESEAGCSRCRGGCCLFSTTPARKSASLRHVFKQAPRLFIYCVSRIDGLTLWWDLQGSVDASNE